MLIGSVSCDSHGTLNTDNLSILGLMIDHGNAIGSQLGANSDYYCRYAPKAQHRSWKTTTHTGTVTPMWMITGYTPFTGGLA